MNHTEAVILCRYVRAACPQQKLDEFTPDVWAELLAGIRFEDAKTAATNIARRQPFVAPAEIITEVKKIRADRCNRHDQPIPPADLGPAETMRWLLEQWKRIGDGETVPDDTRGVLTDRPTITVLTKGIGA